MANKKSDVRVADKPAYSSWAKTVWFAGLGLVSTVEESGVNVLRSVSKTGMTMKEKLQAEADAVITDLVKRGERLEKKGLETIDALRKDATERGKESIDAFDRMVAGIAEDTLNRIEMPTRSEIRSLAEKVRSLTEHVDALSSRLSTPALNAPAIDKAVYMVRFDEAGWTLEKEGSELPLGVYATKIEAVDAARQQARTDVPSHLVIYRKDGSIQEENAYDV